MFKLSFSSPFCQRKHKGTAVLAVLMVSAFVGTMIAVSTAKVTQASTNSLSSNKVALQAQHYASSKAELIEAKSYGELTAQNKTAISDTGFSDEVIISAESTYPADSKIKQKQCTINVYKGSESLPRHTLKVTRYSVSDSSSIPKGAILPWYGNLNSIPNGFALCNGQNGTPDLRDRFIVGAGGSYGLGWTGGANSVLLNESNIANHRHYMFTPGYRFMNGSWNGTYLNGATYVSMGGNAGYGSCEEKYNMVPAINNAMPTVGLTGFAGNGNPTAHENRPPYYSLYYIMKME